MVDGQRVIEQTERFVRQRLSGDAAHDWWHVRRVWRYAQQIGRHEQVDMLVVELAALLHDIADWKFHDGDETVGPRVAREWLQSLGLDEPLVEHVCTIILHLSFKGAGVPSAVTTREGMVVQDADRLDAIGAIGVARAFAYGGFRGQELYQPELTPQLHQSFGEYKTSRGSTINHFHEKLLLLKDRMHTATARHMAAERHRFTEVFLEQFLREWEGS